jgi:hypothetical protein
MATVADPTERRDALVERLFMSAVGAFDLFSVYVGDSLGFYRSLADNGPLTSAALAQVSGVHERYAREWLEQQAASALLEAHPSAASTISGTRSRPSRCVPASQPSTSPATWVPA